MTGDASDADIEVMPDLVESRWFDDDQGDEPQTVLKEYDIISSPNDFNIRTIFDFMESGAVKVPGFQRNYVWDLKKASKLIESILIGLPIPQIFLYEKGRNTYLVIDGQQRLMSIYYFIKGRFPKPEKRRVVRREMDERMVLPASIIEDDEYFVNFRLALSSASLALSSASAAPSSPYNGKNYDTLGEYKTSFDMKVIRNVVIKQTSPQEERESSVFEIFSRLNTGGVNLRPQEIRASLYHSAFMDRLHKINLNATWRKMINLPDPEIHDKDIEILLRVFALVADGTNYRGSMGVFLNSFAKKSQNTDNEKLSYMENLFREFFAQAASLDPRIFINSGRFNIAAFEAVFRASCGQAFFSNNLDIRPLSSERLQQLRDDEEFSAATRQGVGHARYVKQRYDRALAILNV